MADPKLFTEKLKAVIAKHDILRLKGFVDVPGKPMRLVVQAVGPRIE
ncbi:GTP-binding protein, partial [Enterobacter hormaechei]